MSWVDDIFKTDVNNPDNQPGRWRPAGQGSLSLGPPLLGLFPGGGTSSPAADAFDPSKYGGIPYGPTADETAANSKVGGLSSGAPAMSSPKVSPLEQAFGVAPPGFAWNASGGLVDISGDATKLAIAQMRGSGGGGSGGTNGNDIIVQQLKNDAAQLAADSQGKSAVEVAKLNAEHLTDVANINAQATKYSADMNMQIEQKKEDAAAAIAAGQIQLGMAQMASSERLAAAKSELDLEIANIQMYQSQLSDASKERTAQTAAFSQERGQKANAAASVFNSLAQMAPGDNLRSAYYVLRGQAPPPSMASNLPAGLLSALGLNPDTVSAAAQQMRGQISPPPFMQQLMAGQTVASQPAPALAKAA